MQEHLTNKTLEKLKYDLVRNGLITYEDLTRTEEMSKNTGANLAQILIQSNLILERDLLEFIEAKLHIPYVNLDDYVLDKNCLEIIPYSEAKKYKIIPLFKIEDVLTIAMVDPLDLFVLNNLISMINCKIEPIICSERSIIQAIDKYYSHDLFSDNEAPIAANSQFDWRSELNQEFPDETQSQKIIKSMIFQAFLEEIPEIFLQSDENGIQVRFKKDQLMLDKGIVPVLLAPLCISALKLMSSLDPSVSEVPQLGKLRLTFNQGNIIATVATFPTTKGERISIKIYKTPRKLESLPISNLETLKTLLHKSGVIIVCGPDLSGKTSLIYSMLDFIKNKNIMTVESAVKYDLPEINQCELNEKVGFNIKKAVKFIEFQSPDVIYFEQILSKEELDFIISLTNNKKLIITEYFANSLDELTNRFESPEFDMLKKHISCTIFVKNNVIQVMQNDLLNNKIKNSAI